MSYEIQLDGFQGPLEVLYQLVKKNRIEISEISLARISEQYLDYMEKLKDFNLELASEFMVIAAELIEIKIRTLLPGRDDQDEDDEENNLVQRLQEYHYFKKISQLLHKYEVEGTKFHPRAVDIYDIIDEEIEINLEMDLTDIEEAYKNVLRAAREMDLVEEEEKEEPEWEQVKVEEIKVEEKTAYIINRLSNNNSGLKFSDLVENKRNRLEIVVTFLSVLELAKLAKIRIRQDKLFSNFDLV
ncbi:MAG: segregation and condensation protein A [Bacillota bacterium]